MKFSFRVLLIACTFASTLGLATVVVAQDDCMDIYNDPDICGTSKSPSKYSQSAYKVPVEEPKYSQGAYVEKYSQGAYAEKYSQGSYAEKYSQGAYAEKYSQGAYAEKYSQGAYAEKYSQSGYQISKDSKETKEEPEPYDCMDIYNDPDLCGASKSPSKYSQSSYKTSTTKTEEDCGLCLGETIAKATQAIRYTVVTTAKDALSLGADVLDKLGVVDKREPTFTELPDVKKTATSEFEVLQMIKERNRVNTTPTTEDPKGGDIRTPSPTPVVTIPVFTKQQQQALDEARGLGLDIKSPAVEAVVLTMLESTGSPAASTAAFKEIIASTGGNINQAITVNAAFGLASCGTRECQIAEELRELMGLDAAGYQLTLTRQMRDVDNRRQGITPSTSSDDCMDIYGDSETCGTPAPFPQYRQAAYQTNDPEDFEATEPIIQPLTGTCDAGVGCFRMQNVDIVPSTFQRDTLTLLSPTSLFYTGGTDDRIIAPTLTTLSLSHVRGADMTTQFINNSTITTLSVPARSVDTLNLYATANMNPLINAARTFVSAEEFASGRADGTFVERDDDLKVILPAGQIAYETYRGFPVMSPGELLLAGRYDLTRGGRYDAEAELAALELVLNGEAPAATLRAIANGTATSDDLIELSGIITTIVNRSIARGTSLAQEIYRDKQFSSVTDDGRAFNVNTPNLGSVVQNLANGTYAQELGLNSFALDEFAYATHYYSPAGIRYQTGTRSTPSGWDIDFTSPSYVSEGGHIFGNVLVSNGSVHEYAINGRALPLAPSDNGITALAYANTTVAANAPFITLLTPVPPAPIPTLTEDCGLMCKLTVGFFGGPEAARELLDEHDRASLPLAIVVQNPNGYFEIPALVTADVSGATRDEPLAGEYIATLGRAVAAIPGLSAEYFSAGQPAHCTSGSTHHDCVGSSRHSVEEDGFGHTADIRLYYNGELLLPGNREHQEIIAEFITNAVALGLNEIGVDERGGNSMIHVGSKNSPAAWGYGPQGQGERQYLDPVYVAAYNEGLRGDIEVPELNTEGAPTGGISDGVASMLRRYLPDEEVVPPPNTNPRPIIATITQAVTDTVTNTVTNVVDFFGGLFEGAGGTTNNTDEKPTELPDTRSPSGALTIADIVSVTIHLGLDVKCPDLKGVSQNGYVYTVALRNTTKTIERTGCGVGTPDTFAKAIAIDLVERNGFSSLRSEDILQKMTFKFYSAEIPVKN